MDRLQPDQELRANEELVSNNGWFRLAMFSNGNLALYRTQTRLTMWVSSTLGQPGGCAVMQGDGNFVSYSTEGVPYWDTGTHGHPGASVVLQDDGNLVVYDSGNNPLWASNTVQDLHSPTIRYSDASGYSYNETSESWKELCESFPCFYALQWPGYASEIVDLVIDGQPVVIQLWKGWCPKFLGFLGAQLFPGGIGAEVGVYRRIPGKARPTSLPFLPAPLERLVLNALGTLGDNDVWWPFPELGAEVEFTLTNPITNQRFFSAGPEKSYWLAKWMNEDSYGKYQTDQGLNWPWLPAWVPGNSRNTPAHWEDYILDYRINGKSYPRWSVGKPSPRTAPNGFVAATTRTSDKLDIFVPDAAGAIQTAAWEPSFTDGWHGWWQIGNVRVPAGAPVQVVSRGRDKLDVFVVGTDGRGWTAAWEPSFTGGWHGWWPVG